MNKVLRPYTIVPSELYVQRDADRQLSEIIADMGRPGYVLVSRQMGKTNLLLNAKREIETEDDVFIYVDLSNPFDNAKDCFENIIDLAVETNSDKFSSIESELLERRKVFIASDVPPHKQHTYELRLLLGAVAGKIVIVLDEIDALTKTTYSDQIFSQIRSIYFSRVNFKEFSRLTYILSGVVEPSEIIKDSKISPFNIGQKIFLNDFSKVEFESFISKSKLQIDKSVADRIFYWTNGNPRMSWDVCAELESLSFSNKVTISDVDAIIRTQYLTSFDRPPVDNIRELAKNDKEIRGAIVEIEYGKSNQISDRIKNKLYLAGITNYENKGVNIKNNIIRQSLSLDWLRSLEEAGRSLLTVGRSHVEEKKYEEALVAYKKYLDNKNINEEIRYACYFEMAKASFALKRYNEAIEYYDQTNFTEADSQTLYFDILLSKGICYYYLKESLPAYEYFTQIINKTKRDEIYLKGLLNLGGLLTKSWYHGVNDSGEQAIAIYQKVLKEVDQLGLKETALTEIKTITLYNLGTVYTANDQPLLGNQHFSEALDIASDSYKPIILLELYKSSFEEKSKLEILDDLIELLSSDKLTLDNTGNSLIEFNDDILKDCLLIIYKAKDSHLLNQLLIITRSISGTAPDVACLALAFLAIGENDYSTGTSLFKSLLAIPDHGVYEVTPNVKYSAAKYYSYLAQSDDTIKYAHEYVNLFIKYRSGFIDTIDLNIFVTLIKYHFIQKHYDIALKYIETLKKIKDQIDPEIAYNYIVVDHWELVIYTYLYENDRNPILYKAKEFLRTADGQIIHFKPTDLLDNNELNRLKDSAKSVLNPLPMYNTNKPVTYSNKTVIKVKYNSGKIVEKKYKFLQKDIADGRCFIINN